MRRFFRRAQPEPELAPEPEIEVEEEPEDLTWTSSVTFGVDGWYYPVLDDDNGEEIGPDFSRPLIHNAKTNTYEFAKPEHRSHKEYWTTKHPQGREQELEVGS